MNIIVRVGSILNRIRIKAVTGGSGYVLIVRNVGISVLACSVHRACAGDNCLFMGISVLKAEIPIDKLYFYVNSLIQGVSVFIVGHVCFDKIL